MSQSVATAVPSTYTCGSNANDNYAVSGYHKYPTYTLDLSATDQGSTITVTVNSYDIPNKFTIYDANGTIIKQTNWMGYVNYSGPWGQSLNTPQSQSLTFIKTSRASYSLVVETSIQSTSDSWTASISCSYKPNVVISAVTDPTVKTAMVNSFNSLTNVDFVKLSSSLGLSYTLSSNDIDFQNLTMSYDANSPDTTKAINAPFKTNFNNNAINYGFTVFKLGTNFFKPMMIKTVNNQSLKYYNLTESYITTISSYNQSSYAISTTDASYFKAPPVPGPKDCGQAVIDCITDAYSRHGWMSVWLFVQSAALWQTAAVVATACAGKNCRIIY